MNNNRINNYTGENIPTEHIENLTPKFLLPQYEAENYEKSMVSDIGESISDSLRAQGMPLNLDKCNRKQ